MRHFCDSDNVQQRAICDRYGAQFLPPAPGTRIGIALRTLGLVPLNGLRVEPENAVCGWYLWGGDEPSDDEDFYQPMCIEHIADRCPAAVPFLALPPGWRFLTADDYVDVWYDARLINDGCNRAL
jgi:hypothetical protein